MGRGVGSAEGRNGGGALNAPAVPRPAATLVLLRDGPGGLEVLLLQRTRTAAFAPGAWVFAGGLVDPLDAAPAVLGRVEGVTPASAAHRLGLPDADPPAIAYHVAAIREAFEETGILLGCPSNAASRMRDALRDGFVTFADVLVQTGSPVPAGDLVYFAHWITPERSPRRYDTRFFAAPAPADAAPVVDGIEIIEARWISPTHALREHGAGALPMILPTIRTLERLATHLDRGAALGALAEGPVPTILPSSETGGFAGPAPRPRLRS